MYDVMATAVIILVEEDRKNKLQERRAEEEAAQKASTESATTHKDRNSPSFSTGDAKKGAGLFKASLHFLSWHHPGLTDKLRLDARNATPPSRAKATR